MYMKLLKIDKRDFSTNRATSDRQNELNLAAERVSAELSGSHKIRIDKFDKTTGNFAEIISESAPPPESPKEKTDYIKRAQQYLQTLTPALGFGRTQPNEFNMDPAVQFTSANSKIVHARQTYQSREIFQSGTSVRFDSNDAIKGVTGNVITVDQNIESLPKLSARDAVKIATRLVAEQPTEEQKDPFGQTFHFEPLNIGDFEPEVDITLPEDPSMTTIFKQGPFAERIKARLLWFELKPGDLRSAWEIITTQKNSLQYRTIVDATNQISQIEDERGLILYNNLLTRFLHSRMNIYTVNGDKPREMVDCPIPLDKYPVKPSKRLPEGFPDHWNDDSNDVTLGNCTYAHLGTSNRVCTGIRQNNIIIFDPQDPTGDDQKILNMFYFNCYLHDLFYILGFTEENRNFQLDNFGRAGIGSDRVDAQAYNQVINGTASMNTPTEGRSPIMRMGMIRDKTTCFDSDVLYHEFTHGVIARLVGGGAPDSMEGPQCDAEHEGIADWTACTINKKEVVADWSTGKPGGFRHNRYDSNFPHNFGHLGRIVDGIDYSGNDEHTTGEIICATLMEMNRNIGNDTLAMQLVVDALKIAPTNPSFLNMRDSILTALDDKLNADPPQLNASQHKDARNAIWRAFANFGMGSNAQSNGSQLNGIVADFNIPS